MTTYDRLPAESRNHLGPLYRGGLPEKGLWVKYEAIHFAEESVTLPVKPSPLQRR